MKPPSPGVEKQGQEQILLVVPVSGESRYLLMSILYFKIYKIASTKIYYFELVIRAQARPLPHSYSVRALHINNAKTKQET
jgi:hypothetical protein